MIRNDPDKWTGWREATERALYGETGFYRRPEGPIGHFRTSVHASPLFAKAVAGLLHRVDEALGRPAELALVDVGTGRAELLLGVLDAVSPSVRTRLRPYAVERAARPPALDPRVTWTAEIPSGLVGLLFANEWLDNIPVDIAEADETGEPRYVLVRPADGKEHLGPPLTPEDATWLTRWWPIAGDPGARAELGRPRDEAWALATAKVHRGLAVAVDYAHTRAARPPYGTVTGFREGREVTPVPDGSCDITTHVALDACAAPGDTLLTQREALRSLGVSGARPPLALAPADPTAYVRALSAAGEAAELTAAGGLGSFTWLVRPVGVPNPLVPAAGSSPPRPFP